MSTEAIFLCNKSLSMSSTPLLVSTGGTERGDQVRQLTVSMTSRSFGSACFDFICNRRLLCAGLLRVRPLIGLLFRLFRFYEMLSRNFLFQNSSKSSMVWSVGTLLISCYHSLFGAGIA